MSTTAFKRAPSLLCSRAATSRSTRHDPLDALRGEVCWISSPALRRCPLRLTSTNSLRSFNRSPIQFTPQIRYSSSSTRWKARQSNDSYAKEARVAGLKSRAAFKLLEIHAKYRIFRRGDTVVDLGFAPGSWSQVAVSKTNPGGRVVGIDVIPSQPPPGANALQGNFLSVEVRERLREFVSDRDRGRVGARGSVIQRQVDEEVKVEDKSGVNDALTSADSQRPSSKEADALTDALDVGKGTSIEKDSEHEQQPEYRSDKEEGRVVNVVLSDMSAPWPLLTSTWIKSVNIPYLRMMNTSGMAFRDHAGSMDLCMAALEFCYTTLATGGHFLTKYYAGAEDQVFEKRLRRLFHKVHRIKPDSSRKESKESYFLAINRKAEIPRESVLGDLSLPPPPRQSKQDPNVAQTDNDFEWHS